MAQKAFTRNFNEFKGLDLSSSELTQDSNSALAFQNFEVTSRKSARGRAGCKIATQANENYTSCPRYPHIDCAVYDFIDSVPKRELVGFAEGAGVFPVTTGYSFWTLKTGTCKITGPANSTFHFYPVNNSGTVHWWADCRISGVSVGGSFPMDCGTGLETYGSAPTLIRLEDLRAAIVGITGGAWSCALTPYAKVDGTQLARSESAPVTVLSGHTLTAGNMVEYDNKALDIIETTATTVRTRSPRLVATSYDAQDGDVMGVGLVSAAVFPITVSQSVSSLGHTFSFTYWNPIYTNIVENEAWGALYRWGGGLTTMSMLLQKIALTIFI